MKSRISGILSNEERHKTWRSKRSNKRKDMCFSEFVKQSSQTCCVMDNKIKLQGILEGSTSMYMTKCTEGLLAILDVLEHSSFLKLSDAYDIFASYFSSLPDRDTFRAKLMDSEVGLSCSIVTNPHNNEQCVVMQGVVGNIAPFLGHLTTTCKDHLNDDKHIKLSSNVIDKLITSMDTLYDRQCVKAILSAIYPVEAGYRYVDIIYEHIFFLLFKY